MSDTQSETPPVDFEDDVAEMVECMATDALQDGGSTEAIKQQFRDALAKFVDARIAAAFAARVGPSARRQPPPEGMFKPILTPAPPPIAR